MQKTLRPPFGICGLGVFCVYMRRTILFTALLLSACTAATNTTPGSQTNTGAVTRQETAPHAATSGSGAVMESALPDGSLSLGSPDAPVTLTLVTHPSCAYCRDLHRDLLPKLRTEFIDQGIIRLQILILPMRKYPESGLMRAAIACAARENRGSALLDQLMLDHIDSPEAVTAVYARTGSGTAAFSTCLSSPPSLAAQDAFLQEHEVTLVPTFFLANERRVGLPTWADLRGWLQETGL